MPPARDGWPVQEPGGRGQGEDPGIFGKDIFPLQRRGGRVVVVTPGRGAAQR